MATMMIMLQLVLFVLIAVMVIDACIQLGRRMGETSRNRAVEPPRVTPVRHVHVHQRGVQRDVDSND